MELETFVTKSPTGYLAMCSLVLTFISHNSVKNWSQFFSEELKIHRADLESVNI